MFLIDSNILIYGINPEYSFLEQWIGSEKTSISVISQIEILGYTKINEFDKARFGQLIGTIQVIGLTDEVVKETIKLRQRNRIKLGDAIIAATAIEYQAPLITRNKKDFDRIANLEVIDPFLEFE